MYFTVFQHSLFPVFQHRIFDVEMTLKTSKCVKYVFQRYNISTYFNVFHPQGSLMPGPQARDGWSRAGAGGAALPHRIPVEQVRADHPGGSPRGRVPLLGINIHLVLLYINTVFVFSIFNTWLYIITVYLLKNYNTEFADNAWTSCYPRCSQ